MARTASSWRPVRIRRRAVVAAGTTVTRDVPAGALAIRAREQQAKPGYADAVAERYARHGLAKPSARSPEE